MLVARSRKEHNLRPSIRTVFAALFMAVLVMVGTVPASATTGRRVANGDGDAAGKCLSIAHNGAGPEIVVETCNDTLHQDWEYRFFKQTSDGHTYDVAAIFSYHPSYRDKCIHPPDRYQQVYLVSCSRDNPSVTEVWLYSNPVGGQWAQFRSYYYWNYLGISNCLDVADEGRGYIVQVDTCKTGSATGNQIWKVF